MDDTQLFTLVRKAQQGDRDAFGEIVAQFDETVYAIVFKRLRVVADSRDVTQEVFIRAMRKLPQLREVERFCGWLKQIAVRLSINRIVRRPRERAVESETFDFIGGTTSAPFDAVMKAEQAQQVWSGLQQLKGLDRDTLIAFYIEGQSIQEMSDAFRSPVGTIKRRLHTARARLKDVLGELQPI